VVVTCDPTNFFPNDRYINHPAHRAAGQVTLDAVFPAAGSRMFFPELLAEGLEPHKVSQVYVAMPQTPNTVIDVTAMFERKVEALRQHASQIADADALLARLRDRMIDPSSPPESPRYVERFRRIDLA
jgi:LmbE family N-acetylglucosaminyl deacetylase